MKNQRKNKGKPFVKGQKAWNKGLTKETNPSIKSISDSKIGVKRKPFSKQHRINLGKASKGHKVSDIHKEKLRTLFSERIGDKNPNWKGGLSFVNYPPEFSRKLRQFIKDRDLYFCQLCGIAPKMGLGVHHIDHNKNNNSPENLIALCGSCNNKANANRSFWEQYYKDLVGFKKILTEIFDTRAKKSLDYGQSWKIWGIEGIANQMKSKITRIWNLESQKLPPTNESLRDSYKDLAVYSLMGLDLLMRNETENDSKELKKLMIKRFNKINKTK